MKLSLACFAAAVAANDERFFTNKPEYEEGGFMTKSPPKWWNDHSTDEWHSFLYRKTETVFDAYLPGKASLKLKPLFVNLIEQMAKIADKCAPGSKRKRRSDSDETHLVDQIHERDDSKNYLTGKVDTDTDKYTKDVARWAKWVIYDQGGKCEFLGLRLVSQTLFLIQGLTLYLQLVRTDRLRWYMKYAYCKQTDDTEKFCTKFYHNYDGAHPRKHDRPIIDKYPKPVRPEGGF